MCHKTSNSCYAVHAPSVNDTRAINLAQARIAQWTRRAGRMKEDTLANMYSSTVCAYMLRHVGVSELHSREKGACWDLPPVLCMLLVRLLLLLL